MATFVLAFLLLTGIVLAMAIGVILVGQKMRIKGSCGGLNAIAGADKCVVCQKDVDPDSPLRDKIQCKRARRIVEEMETP
ncbi:(Na+)-NQR maturation NqrM [Tropicimonas sp. TH_r6]|uniref:(Na+)-NQR maturation NqrM n=1 Tax=Tropicimonas sp. TH_r6 TaxID=3082085 RepID=UPI002954C0C3|nr:(Na+)-NQR maturation NqrM [Tropicimonas sp. TH_r6]MDV7145303.1 (Na+)-NQR maturation NqrM [Tropicimonas sp. TH_r6]